MRALSDLGKSDIEGRFRCDELDADFVCVSMGGAMFGAFEGFLGESLMELLYPIGEDVWLLPCQRGIDVAPGDWTLTFQRDGRGAIASVVIGCWLARNLRYRKVWPVGGTPDDPPLKDRVCGLIESRLPG